ncbi:Mitochondrial Rho GTPase 2 [Thelohanellus kitauei]|uniref:Mitochondrial Rho GTPase 2 n=1 Tax=Thelohanellus kitauei TaxID=669202 RepID=A0A0C2J1J4_THEKT|nr:Mitochondrial Rho GTPase 2 [Thelohanellus kitauei]
MRDSIWRVLKTFGYGVNLNFDNDYLAPCVRAKPGEYIELNRSGIEFFQQIFKQYDRDGDGGLTMRDLEEMFIDFPEMPITDVDLHYCEKNQDGLLNQNGFLSLFV